MSYKSPTLFTIGFTQTTAEHFFDRLERAGVRRVLDVRLNNASQLAGFAKGRDLPFFLRRILGAGYSHETRLAPTKDILDGYKKGTIEWVEYERRFLELLARRAPENGLKLSDLDGTCLLCSEPTAERCHRRLVAEYLDGRLGGSLAIVHL